MGYGPQYVGRAVEYDEGLEQLAFVNLFTQGYCPSHADATVAAVPGVCTPLPGTDKFFLVDCSPTFVPTFSDAAGHDMTTYDIPIDSYPDVSVLPVMAPKLPADAYDAPDEYYASNISSAPAYGTGPAPEYPAGYNPAVSAPPYRSGEAPSSYGGAPPPSYTGGSYSRGGAAPPSSYSASGAAPAYDDSEHSGSTYSTAPYSLKAPYNSGVSGGKGGAGSADPYSKVPTAPYTPQTPAAPAAPAMTTTAEAPYVDVEGASMHDFYSAARQRKSEPVVIRLCKDSACTRCKQAVVTDTQTCTPLRPKNYFEAAYGGAAYGRRRMSYSSSDEEYPYSALKARRARCMRARAAHTRRPTEPARRSPSALPQVWCPAHTSSPQPYY